MQTLNIKSLKEANISKGARVLVRVDFNVPCSADAVLNDYRIRRALPTLELLSSLGARTVLISHLDSESGKSLAPVAQYLSKHLRVSFAASLSEAEQKSEAIREGEFLLVENIRNEKGEKENDEALAKRLAAFGDIYVNEAFAVSHRMHASVVGVPKFLPSYAGLLLMEEIEHLKTALSPASPSLFVLGGAKFETKLPLIVKFMRRYTRVFVGGALANDMFQAMGLEVGASLVSPVAPNLKDVIDQPNVRTPLDVEVRRDGVLFFIDPHEVKPQDRIMDLGPKTYELLDQFANESKFILWNGPLGVYQEGFTVATEQFAKSISRSGSESVIGGGDTIAAVEKLGLMDKFDFVSTGGGAMLEFLANETLPGIEVLK